MELFNATKGESMKFKKVPNLSIRGSFLRKQAAKNIHRKDIDN